MESALQPFTYCSLHWVISRGSPQRRWVTPDEIYLKTGRPPMDPHCSHLHVALSSGGGGATPGWSLERRWVTLDGIKLETKNCSHGWSGIWRQYCHSSFNNNIWSFCNIIRCCFFKSELKPHFFSFENPFLKIPENTQIVDTKEV
jgi:hypothetical protein